MRRKILIVLVELSLLAFGVVVFAQQTNPSSPVAPPQGTQPQNAPGQRYTVKASDVLGLTFRYTPDYNHDTSVQPDGFVQLKGLPNALHIQGMTMQEAQREIVKAYSTILKDPDITVTLKDFEKPYFVVSGSVRNPGKFDYRGHTTVMQAVAVAGGFDNSAKHSQILLMRKYSNDLVQVTMVDLREVMKGKDLNKDLEVRPGDTIFAPKSTFAKFAPFIPSSSLGMYQH
jgi:polysaccharide export outer membrane protein